MDRVKSKRNRQDNMRNVTIAKLGLHWIGLDGTGDLHGDRCHSDDIVGAAVGKSTGQGGCARCCFEAL